MEASAEEGWFREWSFLRRNGVMPYAGGLNDQDPLFVEACETIEAELRGLEAEHGSDANKPDRNRPRR